MKYFALVFAMVVVMLIPLFGAVNVAHAQFDPLDKSCKNAVNADDAKAICDASKTPTDPINGDDGIIAKVANILAVVAAIIAVIVVIVAGITMMTSNGDAGKITNSRNAIIYTVVGLLVIITARTIVVFILGRVAT